MTIPVQKESSEQQNNSAGVEEDANETNESVESQDTEKTEGDDAGGSDQDSDDKGGDELPEWARDQLSKANAQAANYRTKLREAEDKLKDAKSLEEVESLVSEMTSTREESERSLVLEVVALKYKLPEQLQKRITGTTREEMEADAKELAELLGTQDSGEEVPLEGGLNPREKTDSDPTDPRALAQKYKRKRRF